MSTTAEGRIIIQTETPGWFDDPATGKKTRQKDGDRVLSRAEYEQALMDAEDQPAKDAAEQRALAEVGVDVSDVAPETTEADRVAEREAKRQQTVKDAAAAAPVTLTSGKQAIGQTLTIRCAWVDPDKRTPEQQQLFDSNFAGVEKGKAYDAVKKAAGGKRSAFPDGTERVIKPQDAFQVRFSPENQQKWRAELRRRKTKARRDAALAAMGESQ